MAVPCATDAVKYTKADDGSALRHQTQKSRRQRTWSAWVISIPERERSGTTPTKLPPLRSRRGVVQTSSLSLLLLLLFSRACRFADVQIIEVGHETFCGQDVGWLLLLYKQVVFAHLRRDELEPFPRPPEGGRGM